jgi:hypothetical protein
MRDGRARNPLGLVHQPVVFVLDAAASDIEACGLQMADHGNAALARHGGRCTRPQATTLYVVASSDDVLP